MSRNFSRSFILFLAVCVVAPPVLQGQGIGGAIVGTVRDQSGGVVPAVLIRITNTDTGQARSVSTDNEGRFQARELPPGLYEVRAELGGFNTVIITGFRLGVGQIARQDITLAVAPVGAEVEVKAESEVALTETTTPTLSTSFSDKQIRELPILSRDINNLALLAPGVFNVRAFSFASTLVPFAANGSRGRDNNFIIDSVDNNEPLFGGAATQFTNTDLFAEYRILTNQYKAEYGRNSGSVVNIITERGGNTWRGSAFWFGQHDGVNAANNVEKTAGLGQPVRFYENQVGGTVGGPIKKESTWIFASYQWDRARHDLSPIYPLVATVPTSVGLSQLTAMATSATVNALVSVPSVVSLPFTSAPCGQPGSGLPPTNPCTIGTVFASLFPTPLLPVDFGTFLVPRAGVFDVRDHQFSVRFDHRLTNRDDIYGRYLFDDLQTPRTVGALPAEVAFLDLGLLPEWRAVFKQRTQSLGLFWTHAWPTALNELRASFARISSQTGPFGVSEVARETLPAQTVLDAFALFPAPGGTFLGAQSLQAAFPSAGQRFTLGRDTRPTKIASNLLQFQENFSVSRGRHSIKAGVNFVRTQSNIRQTPSDLGQYLYLDIGFLGINGFDAFVNNLAALAFRRFPNFGGRGGDVLPLRELGQFYFFQDDIRVSSTFTISAGLRYENYGQAINKLADLNSRFPRMETDKNNFAPRVGFAWSPDGRTVLRGGYGMFYNPTVFNIALLAWQSGPISPFLADFFPIESYPQRPFSAFDVNLSFPDCANTFFFNAVATGPTHVDCTTQDTVDRNLRQPYIQNFSLSVQRQLGRDFLVEASYVGSMGTKLYQRLDKNPKGGWELLDSDNCASFVDQNNNTLPCALPRGNSNRGGITEVTNAARSNYHALHVSGTRRLSRPRGWFNSFALTAAYTWSHMIDNASEIFGPGVRVIQSQQGITIAGSTFPNFDPTPIEAVTPFAQDPNNALRGERGNSTFDRRHRATISFLWVLPSPSTRVAKWMFGDWQMSGFITAQSGQPFSPINASINSPCADANGDGGLTNDRPNVGNPNAPFNSVALLNNRFCADPNDPNAAIRAIATNPMNAIVPGAGLYINAERLPTSPNISRWIQVGRNQLGNAGRNILRGPSVTNVDFALLKNFRWGERRNVQVRAEAYNLFNKRNPGNPIGNVFTTDAQPVPGIAFAPVSPGATPARVVGVIPENIIDAADGVTGEGLFLSQRFMNTSSRKFQFAVKLLF